MKTNYAAERMWLSPTKYSGLGSWSRGMLINGDTYLFACKLCLSKRETYLYHFMCLRETPICTTLCLRERPICVDVSYVCLRERPICTTLCLRETPICTTLCLSGIIRWDTYTRSAIVSPPTPYNLNPNPKPQTLHPTPNTECDCITPYTLQPKP